MAASDTMIGVTGATTLLELEDSYVQLTSEYTRTLPLEVLALNEGGGALRRPVFPEHTS